jgi:hypothetical protein
MQRFFPMPAAGSCVEDMPLGVAVRAQQQHVGEIAQQGEQSLAILRPEGLRRSRRRAIEERDVYCQYQQAILRQRRQVSAEEGELILAQPADIGRHPSRPMDDIVEHHERRLFLFPGERVGAEVVAEGAQRVLVAGRVDIHVMVAGGMQPRHPECRGRRSHRRIQGRIVVDDVAEADADIAGKAMQGQRRHAVRRDGAVARHRSDDVAGVVVDVG